MQQAFSDKTYSVIFFRIFAFAKDFVIIGFVLSSVLLNFFHFSPFFVNASLFKILVWNLFSLSLFFFFLAFISFFFLFKKESKQKELYKKNLKWIFFTIFFAVLINLLFLLKANDIILLKTFVLFLIFFPIHIVFMFIGISFTSNFFSEWKRFLKKKNVNKEIY